MANVPVADMVRRIQGEFLEMPGLRLTSAQAQRLWGLDQASCEALLGVLLDQKFLTRTRDGAFVRSGSPLRRSADVHSAPPPQPRSVSLSDGGGSSAEGRRVDSAA